MSEHFIENLQRFAALDPRDIAALENALCDRAIYAPHTDLMREGSVAGYAVVILSGWACRYKSLKNGTRQITAIMMPGDFDLLNAVTREPVDYAVGALSGVTVARIRWQDAINLATSHPAIYKASLALQAEEDARLRDMIVSVGRRSACERLAHQMCSIWCRAVALGLVTEGSLHFPVTQTDLADAVGLTSVHLNRVLQRLRNTDLVAWQGSELSVPDPSALARYAGHDVKTGKLSLVSSNAEGLFGRQTVACSA